MGCDIAYICVATIIYMARVISSHKNGCLSEPVADIFHPASNQLLHLSFYQPELTTMHQKTLTIPSCQQVKTWYYHLIRNSAGLIWFRPISFNRAYSGHILTPKSENPKVKMSGATSNARQSVWEFTELRRYCVELPGTRGTRLAAPPRPLTSYHPHFSIETNKKPWVVPTLSKSYGSSAYVRDLL